MTNGTQPAQVLVESAAYYKPAPTAPEPTAIRAVIDGTEWSVPLAPGNRHYDAIMAAVEAGTLVIQPSDDAPQT